MEINTDMTAYPPVSKAALKPDMAKDGADKTAPPQETVPIQPPSHNLSDVLKFLGFKPSEENAALATNLVINDMPVTKENLAKLNQAMKLTGNMREAVFLLQNGIKLNFGNAQLLKGLAGREITLLSELENIADAVDALPEGTLKQVLVEILSGETHSAPVAVFPDNTPVVPAVSENQVIIQTDDTTVNKTQALQTEHTATQPESPVPSQSGAEIIPKEAIPGNAPLSNDLFVPQTENPPQQPIASDTPVQSETQNTPAEAHFDIPSPDNEIAFVRLTESEVLQPVEAPEKKETAPRRQTVEAGTQAAEATAQTDERIIVIAEKPAKSALLAKMLTKYAVDPETDKREVIDERLNALKEALTQAKRALPETIVETALRGKIDRLDRSLDFINDAQKAVFMQFPVLIGNREENAELYVFKDKGNKPRGNKSTQSALLALDFAFLGRVEAYIQKNGKSVNCRFRTAGDARNVISATIGELGVRLKNSGFQLNAFSFSELDEPFTLLDKEPLDGDYQKRSGDTLANLDIKV